MPEDLDWYPEPAPPSTSRSDVFNPREYLLVDEHALKVCSFINTPSSSFIMCVVQREHANNLQYSFLI